MSGKSRSKRDYNNINNTPNKILIKKLPEYIKDDNIKEIIKIAEEIVECEEIKKVKTNQVRRIYSPVVKIQNQLEGNDGSWERELFMLKPRVIYAASRESKLNPLKDAILQFIEIIEKENEEKTKKQAVKNFCLFMEAVVAYHK